MTPPRPGLLATSDNVSTTLFFVPGPDPLLCRLAASLAALELQMERLATLSGRTAAFFAYAQEGCPYGGAEAGFERWLQEHRDDYLPT